MGEAEKPRRSEGVLCPPSGAEPPRNRRRTEDSKSKAARRADSRWNRTGRGTRIRSPLFSGVQNQSGRAEDMDAAGVTGGARDGRPRQSRIFRMASEYRALNQRYQ